MIRLLLAAVGAKDDSDLTLTALKYYLLTSIISVLEDRKVLIHGFLPVSVVLQTTPDVKLLIIDHLDEHYTIV
jgi:hypothetical protein